MGGRVRLAKIFKNRSPIENRNRSEGRRSYFSTDSPPKSTRSRFLLHSDRTKLPSLDFTEEKSASHNEATISFTTPSENQPGCGSSHLDPSPRTPLRGGRAGPARRNFRSDRVSRIGAGQRDEEITSPPTLRKSTRSRFLPSVSSASLSNGPLNHQPGCGLLLGSLTNRFPIRRRANRLP